MFYLGITLEKELFRVAVIKKEKSKLLLESTHSFTYGPDLVKLFYNLPPFHTGKPITICSGLNCQDLFIRKLHLPLSSKSKILKALPFQLESLIPFAGETPLICTQLKFSSRQMTSVTVIATTENRVQAHLDLLKELDIKPDRVSCTPAALMRFSAWQMPQESKILCLDIREGSLTCVVVDKGEILLSQTLCTETDSMVFEKLSLFLKQKGVIDDTTPWALTGEKAEILNLETAVRDGKVMQGFEPESVPLEGDHSQKVKDPSNGADSGSKDCVNLPSPTAVSRLNQLFLGKRLELTEGDFSVALGLALDSAKEDESSIQFCQKHLLPNHTLQKRKKQILSYAACCLGAACVMGICGSVLVAKKEKLLAKELKTYQPTFSETASLQEIKEGLITWEGALRGKKSTFALVPNVPRVSDLLAYLSTHPALITEEGARKEGVEIESVHYSLVKYPKIGDPSTPYVAQVELQLSSSTPRAARDFHEALLKGDSIVNAKKEIKWQTHNKSYQASFELNKGVFP